MEPKRTIRCKFAGTVVYCTPSAAIFSFLPIFPSSRIDGEAGLFIGFKFQALTAFDSSPLIIGLLSAESGHCFVLSRALDGKGYLRFERIHLVMLTRTLYGVCFLCYIVKSSTYLSYSFERFLRYLVRYILLFTHYCTSGQLGSKFINVCSNASTIAFVTVNDCPRIYFWPGSRKTPSNYLYCCLVFRSFLLLRSVICSLTLRMFTHWIFSRSISYISTMSM